jgi:hypothetical protein
MSVINVDAGITTKHIRDIERTCRELNTFLFIRPSTKETMQLIDQGYATKSMDIHDKSSDWGPASGFVPCDAAFSKALKGTPNPNAHYHQHGDAIPVQLTLTENLATPGSNSKLALFKDLPSTSTERYVKAEPAGTGPKSTIFKLEKNDGEWAVSWMNKQQAVPLYVWGYQTGQGVKPVTGDYDLWMVAPHISRWSQHLQVKGIKDSHGESGATEFITWLLEELNESCGRLQNHVFHHGAESQNYGFTQALDLRLAMFTPVGGSEMVDLSELPAVLVDVQNAGYLVYWNKRYGEDDPHLMGSAVNAGVAGGAPGKTAIEALIAEAALVQSGGTPQGDKTGHLGGLFTDPKAKALIQKNLLGRGNEVPKIQQIQAFHKALTAGMASFEQSRQDGFFKKLEVDKHIPRASVEAAKGDVEGIRLQQQLQHAVMELSQMDHGAKYDEHGKVVATPGATLAPSPEKWKAWESKNRALIRKLEDHFGRAGTIPLRFERIPGTRTYKASELPQAPIPDETVDRLLGPFADLFKKMFPT